MVRVVSTFFLEHRRDVKKDNTAKRASDDKTKTKERDCRVKFPHPISEIQPPPQAIPPTFVMSVMFSFAARCVYLKAGRRSLPFLAYSGEVAEQARKIVGVETKKRVGLMWTKHRSRGVGWEWKEVCQR
jgi:hypothetical protein